MSQVEFRFGQLQGGDGILARTDVYLRPRRIGGTAPSEQRVMPRGHSLQTEVAIGGGEAERPVRQDQDGGDHLFVNVAVDVDQTGLIEFDSPGFPRSRLTEIEYPPLGRREYVVDDVVVVGELDCLADHDR